MQTWAKRGLQTALVTGGMMMLGTGIASADENVDPDSPAGPLDAGVSVPVQIEDNAVGTPMGQHDLPGVDREVSTKPVTDKVNEAAAPAMEKAQPVTDKVNDAAAPVTERVQSAADRGNAAMTQTGPHTEKAAPSAESPVTKATDAGADRLPGPVSESVPQADQVTDTLTQQAGSTDARQVPEPGDDPFMGNKVDTNIALPIQITGNAVGILGDAEVHSDSEQSYEHNSDVSTDGSSGGLAGNVVALDWAAPVQISGNAGSLFGSGKSTGSASQDATTTGDVDTDGSNGAGAGNVVSPQLATPVQVSGNAIAWFLGHSETDFDANSSAESGGYLATNGEGGSVAGNVVGAPVALPVRAANNAATWGGDADASGSSMVDAAAGDDTSPGMHDIDSFIQTEGENGFASGTIAQPQVASLASVTGVAGSWIGNAATGTSGDRQAGGTASDATMTAGGASNTNGNEAAGSGNIVDAPVALPVEIFGVGGTWIGNAHANDHVNSTEAVAGGDTLTPGDESVLSSNTASAAIASAAEVFGVGGAWIGNASGSAESDKLVDAGGYNGTLANESSGSGNLVQVPLATPVEVFGVGGSWIGQGVGEGEETKEVIAGGGGSTIDDYGFANANLVQAPVALPAQVFGVGASWIGNGIGEGEGDTITEAGGDATAAGDKGTIAGNIGFVPVSMPAQVHGIGASWIGNGHGTSSNLTDSMAGGDATTSGEEGSIAGNLVEVPAGGAASVFGNGANWIGTASGTGVNDVVSEAGGDSETVGDGGSIAGNIVSADAMPIVSAFGNAASLTGVANGAGANFVDVTSGGDKETSGMGGAISGSIVDVPLTAVAQLFGNAATVGGVANAIGDNTTVGESSGTTTTAGDQQALSGVDMQRPIGVVAQVYDVPLALLGQATTMASNDTDLTVADAPIDPIIDKQITGSELPATGMPNTPYFDALANRAPELASASPMQRSATPTAAPSAPELPAAPGMPGAGDLPAGELPVNGLLPELSGAGAPELPAMPAQRSHVPQLPADPTQGEFAGALDDVSLNGVELGGTDMRSADFGGVPSAPEVPADVPADADALQGAADEVAVNGYGLGAFI
ncbi:MULTISPECIES: beta strand repeat-containing protein [Prauserella salsuginis group]|uniref:PE-PGRS family protein n=2 Tax=Prauserella salsuginis group TaxID=2893672 RepID=A0A839XMM8_9PSEU|nr:MULTISPECIES: hypothetical protein [Prauserella salsuginis group]MBB3662764.1 hypothetical protein [Prauserella sediminis]MCR3720461.1 hypothetical protein [Prauserella flava]MCR3733829.1 hypothetical protein [Prauserella salsuginis]